MEYDYISYNYITAKCFHKQAIPQPSVIVGLIELNFTWESIHDFRMVLKQQVSQPCCFSACPKPLFSYLQFFFSFLLPLPLDSLYQDITLLLCSPVFVLFIGFIFLCAEWTSGSSTLLQLKISEINLQPTMNKPKALFL